MPVRNIVIGQKVDRVKADRARQLRLQMTPQERTLWQLVRGNRLDGYHFRRQQVIDGFIVDFYCHAAGLAVELDGEIHLQASGYDEERDAILAARGLTILRIRNEEVENDVRTVLERIRQACRAGTQPAEDGTK